MIFCWLPHFGCCCSTSIISLFCLLSPNGDRLWCLAWRLFLGWLCFDRCRSTMTACGVPPVECFWLTLLCMPCYAGVYWPVFDRLAFYRILPHESTVALSVCRQIISLRLQLDCLSVRHLAYTSIFVVDVQFQIHDQFWISNWKLHGNFFGPFVKPQNRIVWPVFAFCFFISVFFVTVLRVELKIDF